MTSRGANFNCSGNHIDVPHQGSEINLSQNDIKGPKGPEFKIVDIDLEDAVAFDEERDFELFYGLADSQKGSVLCPTTVASGAPSNGVVSGKDADDFVHYIETEKSPQLMVVQHIESERVSGAYRYITSGSPAAEDKDISRYVIAKAGLQELARDRKIAWVLDAWIAPEARDKFLYAPLTGRSLYEIFEVEMMEVAVAYVRLSPCPNKALKAHKLIGWELIEGKDAQVHIPYQVPTPAEYAAAQGNVAELDHLKKNEAIAKAGGMKLGIMLYTKARYQERRDQLLAPEHKFENQGDYRFLKH